ncbi:MAG: twin-arginine translocase TatA/TatE family subunit [Phycisphaeraceae bacterium]|nr:twin-arginine translocase TatA/TatE family subunit [Phycisphaeraceae bacterium]MCW5767607.1 twin-arginine translocase TatA/TatE family subunit [Phycisphaeraceae bacterium]
MNTLAFGIGPIGTTELIVILAIGLLLFGKRLPEVGKSLGKGIVEFKKGLKGVEDEIERESSKPSSVARPPLTSGGVDARVSTAEQVEQPIQSEAKPS